MPFTAILRDLTQKTHSTGAVMLDHDGELVASYSSFPSLEIDLIGAHHGIILNSIKDFSSRRQDLSGVKSVSISTTMMKLAISAIKDGYYLVLTMDRIRPIGKALYESQKAVKKIEAEMG
ncbi:MAG: hypothetical protein HYS21_11835 [Deltaproteobacteria bacterium]|nr:hypothetical protein [Deltaproteobacteria bacterium]